MRCFKPNEPLDIVVNAGQAGCPARIGVAMSTAPLALLALSGRRDTGRAMSQENVEVVRRVYAAFAARDWEALCDLCHPDLDYETLGVAPGRLRGFLTVTRTSSTAWAPGSMGEFRVEAEEVVEAGEQVVAPSSGIPRAG